MSPLRVVHQGSALRLRLAVPAQSPRAVTCHSICAIFRRTYLLIDEHAQCLKCLRGRVAVFALWRSRFDTCHQIAQLLCRAEWLRFPFLDNGTCYCVGMRLFTELRTLILFPNLVIWYLKDDLCESVLFEGVEHVRGSEALVRGVHAHVEGPWLTE